MPPLRKDERSISYGYVLLVVALVIGYTFVGIMNPLTDIRRRDDLESLGLRQVATEEAIIASPILFIPCQSYILLDSDEQGIHFGDNRLSDEEEVYALFYSFCESGCNVERFQFDEPTQGLTTQGLTPIEREILALQEMYGGVSPPSPRAEYEVCVP